MLLAGHATLEGTKRYCAYRTKTCSEDHFRKSKGIWWSSLGIGTYLGTPDSQTDKSVAQAIIHSVDNGINVIDTAINYRREQAERSVGVALS